MIMMMIIMLMVLMMMIMMMMTQQLKITQCCRMDIHSGACYDDVM